MIAAATPILDFFDSINGVLLHSPGFSIKHGNPGIQYLFFLGHIPNGVFSENSIAIKYQVWHIVRMEFNALLKIVGEEPVFETGLLLAGEVNPGDVRRQLSRWTSAGKLNQLRRGLYALAPPFQKVKPHPF